MKNLSLMGQVLARLPRAVSVILSPRLKSTKNF